jgi:hypothetical protein
MNASVLGKNPYLAFGSTWVPPAFSLACSLTLRKCGKNSQACLRILTCVATRTRIWCTMCALYVRGWYHNSIFAEWKRRKKNAEGKEIRETRAADFHTFLRNRSEAGGAHKLGACAGPNRAEDLECAGEQVTVLHGRGRQSYRASSANGPRLVLTGTCCVSRETRQNWWICTNWGSATYLVGGALVCCHFVLDFSKKACKGSAHTVSSALCLF